MAEYAAAFAKICSKLRKSTDDEMGHFVAGLQSKFIYGGVAGRKFKSFDEVVRFTRRLEHTFNAVVAKGPRPEAPIAQIVRVEHTVQPIDPNRRA